jgi:hypothetical protein
MTTTDSKDQAAHRRPPGTVPVLVAICLTVAVGAGLLIVRALSQKPTGGDAGPRPAVETGLIGCGTLGERGFSPDLLTSGSADAEKADTPQAAALRALIADPNAGLPLPASGWIAVSESASQVSFVARDAPSNGYLDATFTLQSGTWKAGGYGTCNLMAVPPSGYGPATWSLNTATPITPATTELRIDVQELTCDSGQSPEGRIAVSVKADLTAVTVTAFVRPLSGPQTCQMVVGAGWPPYVVHLDQPLGNRTLLDGAPWPAVEKAANGIPAATATPEPLPSHVPTDCTGTDNAWGDFKVAAMLAKFDVFCAVLPSGWSVSSISPSGETAMKSVPQLQVVYAGPHGESLSLTQGAFDQPAWPASASQSQIELAAFGHKSGTLVTISPTEFAFYVSDDPARRWQAKGSGMSLDEFKTLTTALIDLTA